jgi:3-oxoacyl-[acyl-carrier protein] reductase
MMANQQNSPWQRVSYDYSGLKVLVSGATSGIGAAIAEAYYLAGAEVIVTGTADSVEAYND